MTISWRYDKVGRLKPEAKWLSLPEGVTPALIDKDLWEATQIEAQLAAWQVRIERWDNLTTYCQDVAQNLETFDYHGKRWTLEVLAITVVADGRDWRVSGSMPWNEQAGILSQSSWGWDRPA